MLDPVQFGDDIAQAEIACLVLATDQLLAWPEAGPFIEGDVWRKWKPRGAQHLLIDRRPPDCHEMVQFRHERDWTATP